MVITASTGDPSANAFIKTLVAIILYKRFQRLPVGIPRRLLKWSQDSLEFVERYQLRKNSYLKVINSIRQHTPPSEIEDSLKVLGKTLETRKPKFAKDAELYPPQINLLRNAITHLSTESESAYKALETNITYLNEKTLNSIFLPVKLSEAEEAKRFKQEDRLKWVVEKLTGVPGVELSFDQRAEARKSQTKLYEEFKELRSVLEGKYKETLMRFVRQSGKPYLPMTDVLTFLQRRMMPVHRIPKGFMGDIGEDGSLWINGKKIDGVPRTDIKMNPAYSEDNDETYVFQSVPPPGSDSKPQSYYTIDLKKERREERFDKVEEYTQHIGKIKMKWRADIKKPGLVGIMASMVELIYQTQIRIGSLSGETKKDGSKVKTFGLSSLLRSHASMLRGKLKLNYLGKKGMEQTHLIPPNAGPYPTQAIAVVKGLMEGKTPDEFLFTFRGRRVSEQRINGYLKSLYPGLTAHKFRHIRGTELFLELTKKCPFYNRKRKPEQRDVEKYLEQSVLLKIGRTLGHFTTKGETRNVTGTTARANYVNPSVMSEFFEKSMARQPNWLLKVHGERTK